MASTGRNSCYSLPISLNLLSLIIIPGRFGSGFHRGGADREF